MRVGIPENRTPRAFNSRSFHHHARNQFTYDRNPNEQRERDEFELRSKVKSAEQFSAYRCITVSCVVIFKFFISCYNLHKKVFIIYHNLSFIQCNFNCYFKLKLIFSSVTSIHYHRIMAFMKIIHHKGITNVYHENPNCYYLLKNHHKILSPYFNTPPSRSTITSAAAVKHVVEAQTPRRDPLDLSFANPEAAFKSKTTWEVLRAYIVYQLCSSSYLVDNNMKVCVCDKYTHYSVTLHVRRICKWYPVNMVLRYDQIADIFD